MEFKDKLKQLRSEKGISQQALADAIHISRSAVAKWENGLGFPSQDSLEQLISYFGVTNEYFQTEEPERVIVKKNLHIQSLKAALYIIVIVAALVGFVFGYSWVSSVDENDTNGLARQAADYLGYEELEIIDLEKRGNYLAALCKDPNGNWCMCVFDRHDVFDNRWIAGGGKKSMDPGEIESWNYGSPQREAVIVFCGGDLPENISWYTFENSGIEYTCSVEDGMVLDIFIILDNININGYAIPLDDQRMPIK